MTDIAEPGLGAATGAPEVDGRDPRFRVAGVLDTGSTESVFAPDESGVWVAQGRVAAAAVVVYCCDATRMSGALGARGCDRIVAAIELAVRQRCPVIGVWHSGGARIPEGVESLDGMGRMFRVMTRASGRVPQISVVVGPAAGGAAYGPALTDVVVMAPAGRVFVTGPDVVRSVTGEDIDQDGLGGARAHGEKSGVVHVVAEDEADAYARTRRLTGLLADRGVFTSDSDSGQQDPRAWLPDRPQRAYDVKPLVRDLLDTEEDGRAVFEEIQSWWAPNMVVGLGRLGGGTVGVLANNPLRKGGCLDSLSAEKAARFVRMCDAFGIPLAVLVDVPGYLPGVDQEWGGVVRRGAKLLHAFGEAAVPRITLITRKAYGGAYIAMNSRALGATRVYAWPGAEIAVMGAQAAVDILHRKELAAAPEQQRRVLREQLTAQHHRITTDPTHALHHGAIDAVIDPSATRAHLTRGLATTPAYRGTHNNIPL